MFAFRKLTNPQLRSRIFPQISKRRNYATQKVETSNPEPSAEHRQVIHQQQTQSSISPQEQSQNAKPPPEDDGLYWTALGLLLITPPGVWFYYQYRKEHMGKKKEEVLRKLAEKRAAFQRELGK